jgi:hypothetical protein
MTGSSSSVEPIEPIWALAVFAAISKSLARISDFSFLSGGIGVG